MNWDGSGFVAVINYASGIGGEVSPSNSFLELAGPPLLLLDGSAFLLLDPPGPP